VETRKTLGQWGENTAAEHLKKAGYAIVARNLRSRYGEIDIIAKDGDCFVFVEVRTRRSRAFTPEESVTPAKQRRLATLGAMYLAERGLAGADWRGDVIAIERGPGDEILRLEHHINAIQEPER